MLFALFIVANAIRHAAARSAAQPTTCGWWRAAAAAPPPTPRRIVRVHSRRPGPKPWQGRRCLSSPRTWPSDGGVCTTSSGTLGSGRRHPGNGEPAVVNGAAVVVVPASAGSMPRACQLATGPCYKSNAGLWVWGAGRRLALLLRLVSGDPAVVVVPHWRATWVVLSAQARRQGRAAGRHPASAAGHEGGGVAIHRFRATLLRRA